MEASERAVMSLFLVERVVLDLFGLAVMAVLLYALWQMVKPWK